MSEPDPELVSDRLDHLRFRLPANLDRRKIALLQHHAAMIGEYLIDIGGGVLAGERQQDAAVVQGAQKLLESAESATRIDRVELDAVDAVLANDAAPQRVIEVNHEALLGAAF